MELFSIAIVVDSVCVCVYVCVCVCVCTGDLHVASERLEGSDGAREWVWPRQSWQLEGGCWSLCRAELCECVLA